MDGFSRARRLLELVAWGTILKSGEVLAIRISCFSFGYGAWIFFSWSYIYLAQVRALNLKASAFYAMLPFLATAAFCPLGGTLSDRLTRMYGPRIGCCYLAAAAINFDVRRLSWPLNLTRRGLYETIDISAASVS